MNPCAQERGASSHDVYISKSEKMYVLLLHVYASGSLFLRRSFGSSSSAIDGVV
jgi:hypothetical protein